MSDNPTHGDEDPGFLDAASGIPMSQATRQALANATDIAWADPRKRYPAAAVARRVLEHARSSVARVMSCRPTEIAFVSGTPDDTMALAMRAGAAAMADTGPTSAPIGLIISEVEDVRVLRAAEALSSTPPPDSEINLTYVPVDHTGTISEELLLRSASARPSVVVLQAANGELGTKQPIATVAAALPASSRLVVDARYQVGRCPDPVPGDMVVVDPTKWGGPPGVSFLRVRGQSSLSSLPAPTDGSLGVEPTNPPVPLIAAAALSLELATQTAQSDLQTCRELTLLLRHLVEARISDVQILGHPELRVGYIVMFSFLYVAADELVDELARLGWSVASGSACTSDTQRPLHVLEAIGALSHGNLRVSLPPWTTESTIRDFADDLILVVARIRKELGADKL